MIITKEKELDISGNLAGEDIRMTIDENAIEHLVGLLTDLYSDPEKAIIREISCNAYDAHVAAGQKRPIEITLPSSLNPIFQVQDWGIGLNADGFRNIYSKYGTSTKRQTNDQIGSLGLGCKSPLTYTNQFSVIGIKDGIKTNALIMRDESNFPVLKIVSEQEVDEPNGVTVTIVVNLGSHHGFMGFVEKANDFFSFWEPGTVLINGVAPIRRDPVFSFNNIEVYDIKDKCYISGRRRTRQHHVVMGNVAYPIEESKSTLDLSWNHIIPSHEIVVRVPMGSVHFTPSREGLHYTATTNKALKEAHIDCVTNIKRLIVEDVVNQPTPPDCLRRINHWAGIMYSSNGGAAWSELKYKNRDIPAYIYPPLRADQVLNRNDDINHNNDCSYEYGFGVTPGEFGLSKYEIRYKLHLRSIVNNYWVEGFDRKYTATVKKKLWQYFDDNNKTLPNQFIFTPGKVTSEWVDPSYILKWEDINACKLPSKPKVSNTRNATQYASTHDGQTHSMTMTELQGVTGTLVYYIADRIHGRPPGHYNFNTYLPPHTLVCIQRRQVEAFIRKLPNAIEWNKWITPVITQWWKDLSHTTQKGLVDGIYNNSLLLATALDIDKILDPELKTMLNLVHNAPAHTTLFRYLRHILPQKDIPSKSIYFMERYPLIASEHKEHNTLYINAIWEKLYQNVQPV
jgi:hypothetical protein